MARYIYTVEGSAHKFKTKQEALDYANLLCEACFGKASFDRWIEYMNGAPQRLTIIARHTPEQYKRYRERLSTIDNQ